MNADPLSVAIIGCGQFADEHVKEIQKLDQAAVVAVCDTEPLMAEQLAERYAIPRCYTSVEAMYADLTPDVVHVTTPPQTHLPIGRLACERGSHIYIEKPFTVNHAEAVELMAAAAAAGRLATVGHIYRFEPPAREMRELVARGVLGEPVHVEALLGYNLGGTFGQAFVSNPHHWLHRLPGKLFHNLISHLVDRVLEFLPDEQPAVQVHALLRRPALRERGADLLDELRVMLAGRDVTAYLTFSASLPAHFSLLRVYGTRNTLEVDLWNRIVVVRAGRDVPSALGKIVASHRLARQHRRAVWKNVRAFARSELHYLAGMSYLLRAFYTSIRAGSPPPIPYDDILRTAWIMDRIFEQLPASTPPA